MNTRRIRGVYMRHLFETSRTPAELFDLVYWACFDLFAWGLLTTFLRRGGVQLPIPIAYLIGAAILWNVLYRVQLAVTVTFLKEGWASNMISLLASPLTPGEYLTAAVLWALTIIAVAATIMGTVAQALFSFGILTVGIALVPFVIVLLLFALAMSLVVMGLILRIGLGANILAWGLAGIMQPLSAVFFPQQVLPGWARTISRALPPSHVFEGMRAVLDGAPVPWTDLGLALGLDVIYIVAAALFARRMFAVLRARGFVTRYAA